MRVACLSLRTQSTRHLMAGSFLIICLSLLLSPVWAHQTLVVGVSPPDAPWVIENPDGSLRGFEIELVEEIAKSLGATIKFQKMPFLKIFTSLKENQIDMAAAALTITEDRMKSFSFSQPYYDIDIMLLSSLDGKIKDFSDLNGVSVGVLSGSASEFWLKENKKKYGIDEIKSFYYEKDMISDMKSGRVGAVVGQSMEFDEFIKSNPQLSIVSKIETGDRIGIMFPKLSSLVVRVSSIIAKLKREGVIAKIYNKYMGSMPDPDSSTIKIVDMPFLKAR